jgi:prolyl-tRNA synthetase
MKLLPHRRTWSQGQRAGYHLLNVNLGRDYGADIVTRHCRARPRRRLSTVRSPLHASRGVEVGSIFGWARYAALMGATYLDENSEAKPVLWARMASAGTIAGVRGRGHPDDKG